MRSDIIDVQTPAYTQPSFGRHSFEFSVSAAVGEYKASACVGVLIDLVSGMQRELHPRKVHTNVIHKK